MSDDGPRIAVARTTEVPGDEPEITESHYARVGHVDVRRALPRRGRRNIGAWCFADHVGPADVSEESGLDIGPHPHVGVQTVTWLIDGQALHRDSLGSEQVIAPGQLNVMTAGRGVVHAEEATGHYRGTLQGVQLWIALPEATRDGRAAFEHFDDLPTIDLPAGRATVFIGETLGRSSPARHDSELVGLDLALHGDLTLPLRPDFDHGLIVLEGSLKVNGRGLAPGHLGYLRPERDEVAISAAHATRAILVGGVTLDEPLFMWWNFVARSRREIDEAYDAWESGDERFTTVTSSLARIQAPTPHWR
ncbi:MAG TPA: pirin family protein [Acidimicrobiales bacterium]|nr:pirin family protein [Acidimicrobiales bacterium]